MHPSLLGCAALTGTCVLACNDVSSPTPAAEPLSPSFSATVSRFTFPIFTTFVDESQGLAAVIGLSHDQLPRWCAGEGVDVDEVRRLDLTRPDGSVKATSQGKLALTIYSIAGGSHPCELAEATPLATGTAHWGHTDNDVFVSLNRTNSFGLTLIGTASGPGGARFKVRGIFRTVAHPTGVYPPGTPELFSITPLRS